MPKSITQYTEQRKSVLNRLLEILEIDEKNNMISLRRLDKDVEKQNRIIELEEDIKKYFISGRWTVFNKKNRVIKRVYLSLIKAIFKDMNIKIISKAVMSKDDNNKSICETYYIIEK